MRDWGVMLGGLLVWALHFLLVYGVASMADISDPSQGSAWRLAGLMMTILCLAGLAVIVLQARSTRTVSSLARTLGLAGCALAAIAVIFQGLPLVLST